jgi:ribosomal protein S27AE
MNTQQPPDRRPADDSDERATCPRVCPVCGSATLVEIRQKLHCARCHSIVETCCEGGRG